MGWTNNADMVSPLGYFGWVPQESGRSDLPGTLSVPAKLRTECRGRRYLPSPRLISPNVMGPRMYESAQRGCTRLIDGD